jgi:hypothetical protein
VVFENIELLLQQGVPLPHILYINFEDERLAELTVQDLDLILQAYRELYPEVPLAEVYMFFDEIQNVDTWEKFIRRIHESISKKICVTGSNSKLLGTEIATELRGRTLPLEVFPLSFKEFLTFKGITHERNSLYAPTERAAIINGLDEYLKYGGFPEVLTRETEFKIATLQGYLDVMIYKDLVERYKITSTKTVKFFIRQVLNANTKEFSVHKAFNAFKSGGFQVSKNTLYDYFDYVQAIYLAFVVYKYEPSDRNKELTSRKVYAIDSGLYNAVNTRDTDDRGKLLENALFLHLYRRQKEVYFYKDEYSECDFIVCEKGKPKAALQICYSMDAEETRKREINGLVRACKAVHLDKGTIVTYQSSEPSIEVDGVTITVISALEYLLG